MEQRDLGNRVALLCKRLRVVITDGHRRRTTDERSEKAITPCPMCRGEDKKLYRVPVSKQLGSVPQRR